MKMKTRISRILGGKVLTAAVAGFIILSLIFIVLLSIETRGNRKALVFLISWSPLMISLVIDIINQFTDLPGSLFFNYGLAVTMAYQIVRLIGDLRLQYKEAIRYQQMQKELYEAKVSVMTSQIRPKRNSRSIYSAKNRTSLSGCPVFYLSLFVSNRLRTALVMLFLITTCHQVPQYSSSGSPVLVAANLFFPAAGNVPFADFGGFAVVLDLAAVFAVEFGPIKVDLGVIGFL